MQVNPTRWPISLPCLVPSSISVLLRCFAKRKESRPWLSSILNALCPGAHCAIALLVFLTRQDLVVPSRVLVATYRMIWRENRCEEHLPVLLHPCNGYAPGGA